MKRRYTTAGVRALDDGFGVDLDDRPVRTPGGRALVVATRALAQSIADEWAAQGENIDPWSMPHLRLATTAIDLAPRRAEIEAQTARFAETDLVCYRAERPAALRARQDAAWTPLVEWALRRCDAALVVTTGVAPVAQPAEALRALTAAVADLDDMALCAVRNVAGVAGSLVIALALEAGELDAAGAWAAGQVDEAFQIERWGAETEHQERRRRLRLDLESAALFLLCLADE